MQLNIFVKAAPLLKEKKLNIDVDTFIDFLAHYNVKEWIYPTAIHRKLKYDIKDIYDAMEILRAFGYIEQYLEIYCPECQRYTGQYYKTIGEVPEEVYCENCDEAITVPLEHASVIYRVL